MNKWNSFLHAYLISKENSSGLPFVSALNHKGKLSICPDGDSEKGDSLNKLQGHCCSDILLPSLMKANAEMG